MSKKDVYPPHVQCRCDLDKLFKSGRKQWCVCVASSCACHGCTGARRGRGIKEKVEQAS